MKPALDSFAAMAFFAVEFFNPLPFSVSPCLRGEIIASCKLNANAEAHGVR